MKSNKKLRADLKYFVLYIVYVIRILSFVGLFLVGYDICKGPKPLDIAITGPGGIEWIGDSPEEIKEMNRTYSLMRWGLVCVLVDNICHLPWLVRKAKAKDKRLANKLG